MRTVSLRYEAHDIGISWAIHTKLTHGTVILRTLHRNTYILTHLVHGVSTGWGESRSDDDDGLHRVYFDKISGSNMVGLLALPLCC